MIGLELIVWKTTLLFLSILECQSFVPESGNQMPPEIRKLVTFPKFCCQKSKPKNLSTNAALEVILPDTLVTTNVLSVLRMAFELNKLAPIYSIW